MRYYAFPIVLIASLLVMAGCADLSVENENAPDTDRAIQNASDVKSILGGGFTSYWGGGYESLAANDVRSPQPHLGGWGDEMATTNAFAGFWATTDEPRREFENTLSYADLNIVERPWQQLNAAVSSSNDVIRQISNGFTIVIDGNDETQMVLASAYFLRGLAYGHLANYFDQAYITTEEFNAEEDLETLEFSPYPDVLAQSISDLQQAVQIAESNSFTMDDFLPFTETPTNTRLAQMARSFQARFIISNPRTVQETENIDWQNIRTLTQSGIESDIVMQLDGNVWINYYQYVSGLHWYWRVDNRIIHLMDDDYPIKYPADQAGSAIPPAESDDARLCEATGDENSGSGSEAAVEAGCYFVYDTNQSFFRIERGPTLQSNYFFLRDFINEQWNQTPFAGGDGPIFLEEENNLMEAEAEARIGNLGPARELVNGGSRVNIGELPPLTTTNASTQADVLEAIFYERDIELYRTGLGLAFYDLRRRGALQEGTPLHLPVPATELQTVGEPLYTFGGVNNAGEPGTADGANAWCDQGDLSCDGPFTAPAVTTPASDKSTVRSAPSDYTPRTKALPNH